MKQIAVICICAALAGCGAWERGVASVSGWSRICVDGVSYLQFVSGVTVEWTRDGKVKTCNG